jgi:selenocysteine lyase/cysteine desulfurase
MEEVRLHKQRLTTRLLEGLQSVRGVSVYGPGDASRQVGVVSINIAGYEPGEVAAILDASYAIQVRPGLHCAPLMHRSLGTIDTGGAVRFSLGIFNTEAQIDEAIEAVGEIAASAVAP